MDDRVILDLSTTPDGEPLELSIEDHFHTIRVAGVPLMSSSMSGSEEAMAVYARETLGPLDGARILIGGLGMGFTLRAVLDEFKDVGEVCVAELMEDIVRYNREFFGAFTDHAHEDPRVTLFLGDVKKKLLEGDWDVILMDVDNGPNALTARSNKGFYNARGVELMARALAPGGVLVVWSAYPSAHFQERLRNTGLNEWTETVRACWPLSKGPLHTLFVATKPE